MFDIDITEILVIVIVAIVVIGPKELPTAMRTAGRWIGKLRKVSSHFRTGLDAMVREAELEDMEAKWKAQNEAIMKRSADTVEADKGEPVMTGPPPKSESSGDDNAPPPAPTPPAPPESPESPESMPVPAAPKPRE